MTKLSNPVELSCAFHFGGEPLRRLRTALKTGQSLIDKGTLGSEVGAKPSQGSACPKIEMLLELSGYCEKSQDVIYYSRCPGNDILFWVHPTFPGSEVLIRAMKLENMPVPLTAERVDEYMGPILQAARDGDLSLIKTVP